VIETVATPKQRGRRIGLLALLAAVIALGVTLMPMTAGAVHDINVFELDGNVADDSGAGAPDDWATLFFPEPGDSTMALDETLVADESGDADRGFGSGLTKDTEDLQQWTWFNGGISPGKDDILHAYAASYVYDKKQILYFGQDRLPVPNGSTAMGFWFFQNPVGLKENGTFSGTHKVGDILITSDMQNGGSVSVINIFKWTTNGLHLESTLTNAECGQPLPDDIACAIANESGPISVPWEYPEALVPANVFLEGGINLSDVFQGQQLPCFSTFLAGTRTSPSETADLKDFTLGDIDTCPRVKLVKDLDPDDDPGRFDLTLNGTTSNNGGQGYGNGETTGFVNVPAGAVTIAESAHAGTAADKYVSTVSCDSGKGDATGTSHGFSIANGESVTCTFTNHRKRGKLIVIKHVINDDGGALGAGDFDIDVTGGNASPASFEGAEAPGTEVTLDAGSYDVTETEDLGYQASYSADCSGSIANGETKTCTITNDDRPAKLVVIKDVVNDHGGTLEAADFDISVTGTDAPPDAFAGAEAPGTEVGIGAGPYNVTETEDPGYQASYSTDCSGSIANGETKTCTITNDDKPAKLVVVKHVVNDHGGKLGAADFQLFVTGTDASPSSFPGVEAGRDVTLDAGAYDVTETEQPGYAASTCADCSRSIAN
jgi:hypothetical protein